MLAGIATRAYVGSIATRAYVGGIATRAYVGGIATRAYIGGIASGKKRGFELKPVDRENVGNTSRYIHWDLKVGYYTSLLNSRADQSETYNSSRDTFIAQSGARETPPNAIGARVFCTSLAPQALDTEYIYFTPLLGVYDSVELRRRRYIGRVLPVMSHLYSDLYASRHFQPCNPHSPLTVTIVPRFELKPAEPSSPHPIQPYLHGATPVWNPWEDLEVINHRVFWSGFLRRPARCVGEGAKKMKEETGATGGRGADRGASRERSKALPVWITGPIDLLQGGIHGGGINRWRLADDH
ncbi:hypothetical protein Btru_044207 [Bulinus truncatus]|nr:hypothetical protein Btru_044207 [Bulinus truncatus]